MNFAACADRWCGSGPPSTTSVCVTTAQPVALVPSVDSNASRRPSTSKCVQSGSCSGTSVRSGLWNTAALISATQSWGSPSSVASNSVAGLTRHNVECHVCAWETCLYCASPPGAPLCSILLWTLHLQLVLCYLLPVWLIHHECCSLLCSGSPDCKNSTADLGPTQHFGMPFLWPSFLYELISSQFVVPPVNLFLKG